MQQWPILVCLLGRFQVLAAGRKVSLGGKSQALLSCLALDPGLLVARETLLETIWPDAEDALARHALINLVYNLHKLLGSAIGGLSPVLYVNGAYVLNVQAGIWTDVACFQELIKLGDRHVRAGRPDAAYENFSAAARLYHGDLAAGDYPQTIIPREHLRAQNLHLLARLADYLFDQGDYEASLNHCLRLLRNDRCQEDAHRIAMKCYVRLDQRSQALRQYQLCVDMLRAEFDAMPEPATTALFEKIRLAPCSI
jgi:DNA-binding SARP family transcriptional activator